MQVGGIGAGDLGVYRDYTAILQKSAHIKASEPSKVNTEQATEPTTKTELPESLPEKKPFEPVNLKEAADSLSTIQDFEFIGRDSDITKLDVGKAISDMKKDSILQDYQYFVGTAI